MGGGGNKSQHCVQTHAASDTGRSTDTRVNSASQGTRVGVGRPAWGFRHTLGQRRHMNGQFLEQKKKLLLGRALKLVSQSASINKKTLPEAQRTQTLTP